MLLPLISIPSQPVWSSRQAEHVTNIRSFCPSGGSYAPANTDPHNIPFECALIILREFYYFSLFWVGFILGYVFLLGFILGYVFLLVLGGIHSGVCISPGIHSGVCISPCSGWDSFWGMYFSLFWVGFILGYVFLCVSRSIRCSVTCVGVAVPVSACCLMTPEKKLSSSLCRLIIIVIVLISEYASHMLYLSYCRLYQEHMSYRLYMYIVIILCNIM